MNKFYKKNGITLIALVVTIIVLLILAGISIAMLAGDNGILTRAGEAKEKTDKAQIVEQARLDILAKIAEKKGQDLTEEEIKEILGTYFTSNSIPDDLTDLNQILTTKNGGYEVTLAEVLGGVAISSSGDSEETYAANSVKSLAQAGEIKRWDKVNYNPGSATTASIELPKGASIEETKLAAISLPAGATLGGTISASSASNWVVLDVNQQTGEVLIMPRTVSSTMLTLTGKDGYSNAIEALDKVAGIYKNEAYAQSARSLTVEDVNKVENYTPNGRIETQTWTHRYGMDSNLNITDAGEGNTASQTYTSTVSTGPDCYRAAQFGQNCWLASRYVWCCVTSQDSLSGSIMSWMFDVRVTQNGLVEGGNSDVQFLFKVIRDGGVESRGRSHVVWPVVALRPEVQMESGAKFYTQTATATATVTGPTAFEHNEWNLSLGTN